MLLWPELWDWARLGAMGYVIRWHGWGMVWWICPVEPGTALFKGVFKEKRPLCPFCVGWESRIQQSLWWWCPLPRGPLRGLLKTSSRGADVGDRFMNSVLCAVRENWRGLLLWASHAQFHSDHSSERFSSSVSRWLVLWVLPDYRAPIDPRVSQAAHDLWSSRRWRSRSSVSFQVQLRSLEWRTFLAISISWLDLFAVFCC